VEAITLPIIQPYSTEVIPMATIILIITLAVEAVVYAKGKVLGQI
jgi:hypothetical protein